MISTSTEYKTAVLQDVAQWNGKLEVDYTDYNLDNTIATTLNNSDRLSDDSQLADGLELPTYNYWSWDSFVWGQHLRSTEHTNNEKGALDARLSDSNKNFPLISGVGFGHKGFGYKGFSTPVDYPKFTVSFNPRTVSTIKILFDGVKEEWAETFDVNIYVGSAISHAENVTTNTTYRYTKTLSSAVLLATSIELVVKKWNKTSEKAKVMEMFTSISETYLDDDLIQVTIHEEVDPKEATTPIGNITANVCTATILNEDAKFDNDNGSSILANNIIKNRRLKPSFWVNDLTGDLLQGGTFYSTQWTVNNNRMTAQVSGQDILGLMQTANYNTSQFITPGIDEVFIYTSTADFSTFTLDNMVVGTDEILFNNQAVSCGSETVGTLTGFGHKGFGYYGFNDDTYCGTAQKIVSYTYTPGTSAAINISYNGTFPTGSRPRWYINYKTVEEFEELLIDEGFTYLPEDPTDTSQAFDLKLVIENQSTSTTPIVTDITVTVSESITLLSLASLVIESYDNESNLIEGNYFISQDYASYSIPVAYITPQNYTDALRLICQAAGGRGFAGKDGSINLIVDNTLTTSVKDYTDSTIAELNKITNPQTLYNRVIVLVNKLEQAASPEEIAKQSISIANGEVQTFTIKYKTDTIPADTITYSGLPGSVTITDSTLYVWGAELEVTNASGSDQAFDLSINGKPYRLNGEQSVTFDDTESIRLNGVIEYTVNNPLVQSTDQATQIAQNIAASFGIQKKELESNILVDPSIELGDTIGFNGNYYYINTNDFEFSKGSFTHSVEGKR